MTGFEKFSLDSGHWAILFNALPAGFILSYFWPDVEESILGFLLLDNYFIKGFLSYRSSFFLRCF